MKGGKIMKAEEKAIIQRLAQAFLELPENKREYILGYAEGTIAMADFKRSMIPSEPQAKTA